MTRQALYRKWRSQTFADVIGQHHVTQTLQNALATDRIGHAYLFTGPRGTGKTSTARILAKAVNCIGQGEKPCNTCTICRAITENRLLDLIEIDAASNTSVDDIRDLRDKVDFRPGEAKTKFYIIDEVHMLSKSAFNALLKTLEEPPPHVIFVLATTEPEKIPATILSRCQRFDFKRIKVDDVAARLQFILDQEGLKAEESALTFIARQGGGSMRDAISLLDQLTAYGNEAITLELVHTVLGAVNAISTSTLVGHLLNAEINEGLTLISEVINSGVEPRQFTLEILEYLRGLLLLKYDNPGDTLNLPQDIIATMHPQSQTATPEKLLFLTQRFNRAVKDFKAGAAELTIPQLPLELAFVEGGMGEITAKSETVKQSQQTTSPVVSQPSTAPVRASSPSVAPAVQSTTPQKSTVPPITPSAETQSIYDHVTSLTKNGLRQRWGQITHELKQHRIKSDQYLNKDSIADVDINGNTITIWFTAQYAMSKSRLEKHKTIVVEAFQKVLGKTWLVEFSVFDGPASEMTSNNQPVNQQATSTQASSPEINVEDDELVKTALELGGEIKDVRSIKN